MFGSSRRAFRAGRFATCAASRRFLSSCGPTSRQCSGSPGRPFHDYGDAPRASRRPQQGATRLAGHFGFLAVATDLLLVEAAKQCLLGGDTQRHATRRGDTSAMAPENVQINCLSGRWTGRGEVPRVARAHPIAVVAPAPRNTSAQPGLPRPPATRRVREARRCSEPVGVPRSPPPPTPRSVRAATDAAGTRAARSRRCAGWGNNAPDGRAV